MGVLARQIFCADSSASSDAHVLQDAIINEGERLAVESRKQKDDAAIGARLPAIFFLGPIAVAVPGPGDDVGFHADGEIAVVRAFHRTPAKITVIALAGKIHIDARSMN